MTVERERLEYLRGQLRAESISYGELHELQSLAAHIEPGDVELLEAAGVPEFPDADLSLAERLAELREAGWESVAEDLEDGIAPDVVLRRLRDIGEEDSDAYEIVSQIAALQPEEDDRA